MKSKSTKKSAQSHVVLDKLVYETFRQHIRGEVILAGEANYESARKIWNGMIDKHPAVIVRCAGNADVIRCVRFAREHHLPVAVRGGGHNVSGNAVIEAGMVIDLSMMRSVQVNPEEKRVWVEGGAKLGDIDHETQEFGLAVPMGVVSKTGIGGLTLHGGYGFLSRKYGLTIDNMISATVVTADGRLLKADNNQNPDLFWAIRGGGGNFGVVTSFEFQLHPVGPEVWIGLVMYPVSQARQVLQAYRAFRESWPDELFGIAVFWNAPTEEPIPEEFRGAPIIALAACYCGDVEKGEQIIQPLRELGTPLADLSGRMPFVAAQQIFDPEYPDGRRYYWKAINIDHLNDEVIDYLIDLAAKRPSTLTSLDVWMSGGAISRVKPDATAYAHRDVPFMIGIESNWISPADDEANIRWSREVYSAMQRYSSGGTYLNFPGFLEEGEALIKSSYAGNYDRLQAIKEKYDPDNFFSSTMNILPKN
jgi:FAD/FMN-containing dehydrogenase